ncbi:M10 family metallopeptidase C-terminal domain-containing protein [Ensifer soli]|uniref:M10 family metallopeptidase C-terminal domain-containing protein n=1 Tax=Ciceribacter sp. sgz301302 TaxID=3342379 RepID=UPI0035B7E221
MNDFIHVDPALRVFVLELGTLGYVKNDVVYVKVTGNYVGRALDGDGFANVFMQTGTSTFEMSLQNFHRMTLDRGVTMRIRNGDKVLGDNVDPDGDFGFELKPGLFTSFNNTVDFNALTAKQAEAIAAGEALYDAMGGNDVVFLPNAGRIAGWKAATTFLAGEGNDTVTGGNRNDRIDGGAGDDTLAGGAGSDRLTGGLGADDLHGGAGRDVFLYRATADSTPGARGRDTIFDFAAGDRIDLKAIDANGKANGNQAFTFIETAAFSGKAGELRYETKASDTYVFMDVNGDRKADMAIHLDDALILAKGMFIL